MRAPERSCFSSVVLPVAILLLATPSNSGAITLTPASGCTFTQPASFTCSEARKLKTEVPVSEFSSCSQARITCRSTAYSTTEDLNCYIFSNLTAATQYERYTSTSPAIGAYISGCADAQNCDMPFSPTEVLKSSKTIYVFADKDYSRSKGGIIISAECIVSGASGVGSATGTGCLQNVARAPVPGAQPANPILPPSPAQSPACAGLAPSVVMVPEIPGMGSPYLFSPNISSITAYVCNHTSYITSLRVLDAHVPTVSITSLVYQMQGNCSDGTVLPAITVDIDAAYMSTCVTRGFPPNYTSTSVVISDLTAGQEITYRSGRSLDNLFGAGGSGGVANVTNCPIGQYVIGYAGMATCRGLNLVQLACGSATVDRGLISPISIHTAISSDYIGFILPSNLPPIQSASTP